MFKLPPLPFAVNALAPHMSETTLKLHHGKHHKGYVEKLNGLVAGSKYERLTLAEIVHQTCGAIDGIDREIFNNAAQCWNHAFFWNSLHPEGGGRPPSLLMAAISRDFGDLARFSKAFVAAGEGHFGSGWCWLVVSGEKLEIVTTHDADLPFAKGKTALLNCDLWEHAYYLDYQNARKKFVETFVKKLANWSFAETNLLAATGGINAKVE